MKKQTAVEWLVKELNQKIDFIPMNKWDEIRDIVQQAKEMEKQQIIDIVEKSRETGLTAEYLLLTYGSKGSDECQFEPTTNTSSATICKHCGKEKFLHQ